MPPTPPISPQAAPSPTYADVVRRAAPAFKVPEQPPYAITSGRSNFEWCRRLARTPPRSAHVAPATPQHFSSAALLAFKRQTTGNCFICLAQEPPCRQLTTPNRVLLLQALGHKEAHCPERRAWRPTHHPPPRASPTPCPRCTTPPHTPPRGVTSPTTPPSCDHEARALPPRTRRQVLRSSVGAELRAKPAHHRRSSTPLPLPPPRRNVEDAVSWEPLHQAE